MSGWPEWTGGPLPPDNARINALEMSNDILRNELYGYRKRDHRAFWRGTVFGVVLTCGALLASAAFAQTPPEPRMSLEAGTGDCFAVVAIANRMGLYNQIETLHTSEGPVVLRYETVGGHNATDADNVSVVSLPDGVIADPEFMALPDGETGRVCLILWVGL